MISRVVLQDDQLGDVCGGAWALLTAPHIRPAAELLDAHWI